MTTLFQGCAAARGEGSILQVLRGSMREQQKERNKSE